MRNVRLASRAACTILLTVLLITPLSVNSPASASETAAQIKFSRKDTVCSEILALGLVKDRLYYTDTSLVLDYDWKQKTAMLSHGMTLRIEVYPEADGALKYFQTISEFKPSSNSEVLENIRNDREISHIEKSSTITGTTRRILYSHNILITIRGTSPNNDGYDVATAADILEKHALKVLGGDKKTGNLKIWLYGHVVNYFGDPLPRLKIEVGLYPDAEKYQPGQKASKQYETTTDINGLFYVEIVLPEDQEKQVALLVKLHMNCQLVNNKNPFYIVDMAEARSDHNIWAASLIKVEPSDQAFGQLGIIPVHRLFSFSYLAVDVLSSDDKGNPDDYSSNVRDAVTVAASSYLYRLVWDAMFFGAVMLDEVDALINGDLRIETRWKKDESGSDPDVSHFQSDGIGRNGGTIRLEASRSRLNDESKATLLHEYGHYFDCSTNNGQLRTNSFLQAGTANTNHGGYMNDTTADSYMEGFATAYAAMVQKFRKDSNPHRLSSIDLGNPGRFVAYQTYPINGKIPVLNCNEELAIATLLYQTSLLYQDKQDFWAILKPDRKNLKEYYAALAEDLKQDAAKLSRLEELARLGGLYRMPYGSGAYEEGEPYLNSNNNNQRDSSEPYADLAFAVGSDQKIDFSSLLQPLPDRLEYGTSADFRRQTRETLYRPANSYLQLEGEPVTDLVIRIYEADGSENCYVATVEDNKVYLPVVDLESDSWIDISVPGGGLIFSAAAEQLLATLSQPGNMNDSLASAVVYPDDVVSTGQWAVPAEGRTDFDELMPLPDLSQAAMGNRNTPASADDVDLDLSLAQLAAEQHGRPWPPAGSNWKPILILVAVLAAAALVLILVIVLILNARRKRQLSAAPAGPVQFFVPPAQFCRNCGSLRQPGAAFCNKCGRPFM